MKEAPAASAKNASGKSTKADKDGAAPPKLLSGGNPQIAKGYGDAPVQAYIAAVRHGGPGLVPRRPLLQPLHQAGLLPRRGVGWRL